MSKVPLTLAIGDYDHVRDLFDGTVPVGGVDLTVLRLPVEEIFYRFLLRASSTSRKCRLPRSSRWRRRTMSASFRCRYFHRACSATRRSTCAAMEASTGPKTSQASASACPNGRRPPPIYSRGLLAHEYGVDLASIHWHQAGVNEPGRHEKVTLELPPGFRLTAVADRSLSDMLLAGELDAVLSARHRRRSRPATPACGGCSPTIAASRPAYARKTGIFPIMHVVACDREIYERDRWLAMNLFKASTRRGYAASHARRTSRHRSFRCRGCRTSFVARASSSAATLALRHRGQPEDARRIPALCVRAGRLPPPADGRGAFPAGSAFDVQDLTRILLARILDVGIPVELDVVEHAVRPSRRLRMYTVCTMSRVSGSIVIGPRGLINLHSLQRRDELVARRSNRRSFSAPRRSPPCRRSRRRP